MWNARIVGRLGSLSLSTRSLIPARYLCTVNNSRNKRRTVTIPDGPGIEEFLTSSRRQRKEKVFPKIEESDSYLSPEDYAGNGRKVKLITYGCQMNVSDTEIVRSLLVDNGYLETEELSKADVVLLMTCSIREGAEDKIWRELRRIKKVATKQQTVGVLGCMAERIRDGLLAKENHCDVVAGPDSYRDLPRLLAVTRVGGRSMNVQLSLEETYADIAPVRMDKESKSAFVSIMRGCDNMCTYCVVPLTRGRERSRPIDSILEEIRRLSGEGVKQIVLLGQNVNSYRDTSQSSFVTGEIPSVSTVPGFKTVYKAKQGGRTFVTLLEEASRIDPEMRIRFTSPHPKDFPIEVIDLIASRPNICNQLHLPAQSGDNLTLENMGRGYTREVYLELVEEIRKRIPDVSLTSDFIAGFCGETEEGHQATLDLMRRVKYEFCYVFPYSMRERTRAHYRLVDDVPEEVKRRRHEELARVFREEALEIHRERIGKRELVLVEGISKRSSDAVQGRTDGGTKVVFDARLPDGEVVTIGDYVEVKIREANSQTMLGDALRRTTLKEWTSSEERNRETDENEQRCTV